MKKNFHQLIVDFDGKALAEGGEELTYRDAAITILLADAPGDQPADKLSRFKLAQRLHHETTPEGLLDITVTEAKLIQERVGKVSASMIVGRFDEFLNSDG